CLLTEDMQNRRIVNQHLAESGVRASPSVESNSTISLISHVMTGRWASVLPKKLADLFVADGLRAIPIVAPEVRHLVGLIAAHREPHTPILAALLEAARRSAEVER
ncbi:MAG: LysR family transcriptional regulator substrate-binding protein, partial [Cereibacter changlensis]